MRRNWMIGAGCVLALVLAFAVGYRTGTGSRAEQLIDARRAGEDFQRAFYEGVDKAQAERAEKNRLEYEQQRKDAEARKAHEQQIYDEAYRAEEERLRQADAAKESPRP